MCRRACGSSFRAWPGQFTGGSRPTSSPRQGAACTAGHSGISMHAGGPAVLLRGLLGCCRMQPGRRHAASSTHHTHSRVRSLRQGCHDVHFTTRPTARVRSSFHAQSPRHCCCCGRRATRCGIAAAHRRGLARDDARGGRHETGAARQSARHARAPLRGVRARAPPGQHDARSRRHGAGGAYLLGGMPCHLPALSLRRAKFQLLALSRGMVGSIWSRTWPWCE